MPSSSPSMEAAKDEAASGSTSIPTDTRRSSSVSGLSLFTAEDRSTAGSSDADSQTALSASSRAARLSRQFEENIPPRQTTRRQSFDMSARGPNTSQRRRQTLDETTGDHGRDFGTGTMSEHQRALNVKRARKMTQLFGQEPPSELIQIHDERGEDDTFSDTAAALTISTAVAPLRDRGNSVSSMGTLGHDVEEEATPTATSAPFTTITEETSEQSNKTSFQDRRRRAAKLSRFFGVGFQDIVGWAQGDTTTPAPPEQPETPRSPVSAVTSFEVDVKVSGPGRRFFGVFNDRSKDVDEMQDAIQKLRGLRAG
ncbi:Sec7 domain protein [Favolaschia claudopus]|uniref:Sec7 domain protein n=1 Tax=Favolaschia claudopus TaxID=2862362 RepID=A0AAW0EK38_9AGAR